jgi:hypothetical protein
MAATGYTPISLYYSATASSVPLAANLVAGELALNTNDGKLYYKNSSNVTTLLASTSGASGDVVGPASATANGIALFNSTTGKLIKDSAASDGLIYGLTVGRGAGAVASNTAVGNGALQANTSGSNSTAVGYQAGYSNTTGSSNVGLGYQAGYANTASSLITAIGTNALQNNTAADNTAIGYQAGQLNTTGTGNFFGGSQAGAKNTTGNGNTAIGTSYSGTALPALNSNTTGSNNTAIGCGSLGNNTTASNNTAVGYQAGYTATGAGNQLFGYSAGSAITTGAKNVIIGSYSGSAAPISATGSNYIVLSDGDGTVRQYYDSSGVSYFNSGFGSNAAAYGCRAWVYYNGSQTILGSANVTSLTINGTGDVVVNLTTNMPDANYAVAATTNEESGTPRIMNATQNANNNFRLVTWNLSSAKVNNSYNYAAIFR